MMILLMVSTTSTGCLPVAVSPLSITASAPSITALATSVLSLLLGLVRVDHAFHHLCGHNNRLGAVQAFADDLLLDQRNLLNRHFNTQVTTGDHDTVRFKDDLTDIGKRFRFFDFGNHFGLAVFFRKFTLDDHNVFHTADKRKGNPVQFLFDDEFKVTRSFSVNAGREILVSGRLIPFLEEMMPPSGYFNFYISFTGDFFNLYFDLTIIDHDLIADLNITGQVRIGNIDFFHGAHHICIGESEDITFFYLQAVVFDFANPQFGALQVAEDGNIIRFGGIDLPDMFNDLQFVFM